MWVTGRIITVGGLVVCTSAVRNVRTYALHLVFLSFSLFRHWVTPNHPSIHLHIIVVIIYHSAHAASNSRIQSVSAAAAASVQYTE